MRYILIFITALLLVCTMEAQVRFNVNLNFDRQPVWGPVGVDYAENYYLPDIEVYYNVSLHRFYYNQRGRWISSSSLPSRYRDYDLYNSYKVVVNDRNPWRNHNANRDKYESYKGRRDQQPIRDSRDSKYFTNKNHPEHNNWIKQQRNESRNRNDMRMQNKNSNDNKPQKQNDNKGKRNKGKK